MMLIKFLNTVTQQPLWTHAAAAVGTITYFQWIKGRLDSSYARSLHPVDYATGQTTFSGPTIKGYYATMSEAGTLDIYVRTQLIDFGFILAMICIAAFVCTLVARLSRAGSLGRRVGILAGLSVMIGAVCDAIENGWSFVMLANPVGFADWLAIPYSTFACVKFALVALGMLLLIVSLGMAILGRLLHKPTIA